MKRKLAAVFVAFLFTNATAQEAPPVSWQKFKLNAEFYGEGACFGDIDGDGANDIVSGPWVYFGPKFSTDKKAAIYEPKPFNKAGYSDNFFSFTHDIDGDEDIDVLVLGFPGKDASWFENPGAGKKWEGHWTRHQVLDIVDNESPDFTDLTGDGKPEIVCSRNGVLGYAEINADSPEKPWTFTAISPEKSTGARFTHGLGIGDVNGDGRMDLLEKQAWWEQPESLDGDPLWKRHVFAFSGPGGADMFAYDFDGDGDNDVVTSLAAHAYGFAWYEQIERDGKKALEKRMIMGQSPAENPYGVAFSQLHALALADIDGDGVKDIVTGKRHWAHNSKDPGGNDPAVLYWFRTKRGAEGVEFVPYQIDDDSGIGTDVQVGDVNGDGLLDIIVGNKKGTFLHLQKRDGSAAAATPLKLPVRKKFAENGLTPEEAVKQMSLTEGFRVRIIAAEPDVTQPIAMAIDERGRLWIAEAHSYPIRQPEDEGKDRILIFADEDGDGEFETRKVFAEGLNLVSGIEVGFGGVWVGAAPYLLFIPDKDRDDLPDGEPDRLLDGFGYEDTHETLNSFVWGPDGWLYGCHGVFTHSKVGKPGAPDAERVPLNAGVWRYHPVRHEFEVFAHGTSNPWGLDFDEHGEAFVTACVIPHLFHMVPGGRYHRQGGQHFNAHTYADIQTIADHAHYAGNIRDHAHWGGKKSEEYVMPGTTLDLGGGHAHAGLTIYQGDQFPEQFRGKFLFANLHGHGIISDYTIPEGSGFTGKHGADFLHTNDRWSMPIDIQVGPDGGLFVIDWYDRQNCHRRDAELWDRSNGRIYKVEFGEKKPSDSDDFSVWENPASFMAALDSSEAWWFNTGRRLVQEKRADQSYNDFFVDPEVEAFYDPAANLARSELREPFHPDAERLKGMFLSHSIGPFPEKEIAQLLSDPSARIRAWTIRLTADSSKIPDSFIGQLAEIAESDSSPIVRRELASLLQRLPQKKRWDIANNLLTRAEDAEDHNIPLLIWYGVEPLVMEDPERALELAGNAQIPQVRQFIFRRLAHEDPGRELLLTSIVGAVADRAVPGNPERDQRSRLQVEILNEIAVVLKDRARAPLPASWDAAYAALSSAGPEVQQTLEMLATKFGDKRMLPRLRQLLADPKAEPAARESALNSLIAAKDADALPAFRKVVTGPESPLRAKVIRALASFTDEATPEVLFGAYEKLAGTEKVDAVNVLASNRDYALTLLNAVGEGRIASADISAFTARQIRAFDDRELNAALEKHWGKISESSAGKKAEFARYKKLLTPEFLAKANHGNGRALFNQTCFACHTLFGEGNAVGPDITGGNRMNLDFLLENILDPSAVLGRDYRLTVFTMNDSRVVSGMIRNENDSAVRVALVGTDEQLLPKADIQKRQPVPISMMPEGILSPFTDEQVRDLVAYVQSPKQVRLSEPGEIFYEGENLTILKSTGDPKPQPMGNFKADSWSGKSHLWWINAKPNDELVLQFSVPEEGRYAISSALTKAVDYGIFRIALDGEAVLAEKIDLFNGPTVITTGELNWGEHELKAGKHTLNVKVTGSNPAAVHRHMFGIDYLRLMKR